MNSKTVFDCHPAIGRGTIYMLDFYHEDKDHFVHVLDSLFTPALEGLNYHPIPPSTSGSEIIHADIIDKLSNSDLVLCDISALNPNVFFELGIRTALDKPVSLVVDNQTHRLPFDTSWSAPFKL